MDRLLSFRRQVFFHDILAVHHGNGNFRRTVTGCDSGAIAGIERLVVSWDRACFQDLALSGWVGQGNGIRRRWSNHGIVRYNDIVRIEFVMRVHTNVMSFFVKGEHFHLGGLVVRVVVTVTVVQRNDPDAWNTTFPSFRHHMGIETMNRIQASRITAIKELRFVVAIANTHDNIPPLLLRIGNGWCCQESHIRRATNIGRNPPLTMAMFDLVQDFGDTRCNALQLRRLAF
mmetsp:Transcript_13506/g.22372  ORF Transcript_13506/g.22372 Transcript_13506/m.22372 type:complete len:230 (+) Transcript_13506:612-1301(+)